MKPIKKELRGFLGKDPEFRNSEKPCIKFSLAENVKGQNRPIWYEVFSYVDIQDIQNYLKKGMGCFVIGTLREKQIGKRTFRHVIVEDNEIDTIRFRRDVPNLRNNY